MFHTTVNPAANEDPGTSFGSTGMITPIPNTSRNSVMKMKRIAGFGRAIRER